MWNVCVAWNKDYDWTNLGNLQPSCQTFCNCMSTYLAIPYGDLVSISSYSGWTIVFINIIILQSVKTNSYLRVWHF